MFTVLKIEPQQSVTATSFGSSARIGLDAGRQAGRQQRTVRERLRERLHRCCCGCWYVRIGIGRAGSERCATPPAQRQRQRQLGMPCHGYGYWNSRSARASSEPRSGNGTAPFERVSQDEYQLHNARVLPSGWSSHTNGSNGARPIQSHCCRAGRHSTLITGRGVIPVVRG